MTLPASTKGKKLRQLLPIPGVTVRKKQNLPKSKQSGWRRMAPFTFISHFPSSFRLSGQRLQRMRAQSCQPPRSQTPEPRVQPTALFALCTEDLVKQFHEAAQRSWYHLESSRFPQAIFRGMKLLAAGTGGRLGYFCFFFFVL